MVDRLINLNVNTSLFLFGARGTGKSTLVKNFFLADQNSLTEKRSEYINLLLDSEFYQLSRYPDSLISRVRALSAYIEWVIIDEIQRIPKLLNVVH
jgi:uncharacterized protein